jgi:hypothetical protein
MMRLSRFFRAPLLNATRLYYRLGRPADAPSIVTEDWDTLIVLDACRYDMFRRLSDLPGTLERRQAVGSATDEFVRKNFDGETFEDIVYVSANPRVSIAFDGAFHAWRQVWREGWNEELQTVDPQTVVDVAREVHRSYPQKRVVVHFMQPHAPFIGEYGRSALATHSTLADHRPGDSEVTVDNIWEQLAAGEVELDAVERAYDENLEIVLSAVQSLLEDVTGRVVVTSDHGNLLGERLAPFYKRFYGHPKGLYAPPLVDVPWHVVENGPRREIVPEPIEATNDREREDVQEKLEALGYA